MSPQKSPVVYNKNKKSKKRRGGRRKLGKIKEARSKEKKMVGAKKSA